MGVTPDISPKHGRPKLTPHSNFHLRFRVRRAWWCCLSGGGTHQPAPRSFARVFSPGGGGQAAQVAGGTLWCRPTRDLVVLQNHPHYPCWCTDTRAGSDCAKPADYENRGLKTPLTWGSPWWIVVTAAH